jgi:EAL domain-containing protein (putative c-di-GMP-specific phosphodiesterase class I)
VVQVARIFKLEAVVEGIENATHLERLQSMRCNFGQGFYFARPLSGEEALAMASRPSFEHALHRKHPPRAKRRAAQVTNLS